jgi:hypothetical protein
MPSHGKEDLRTHLFLQTKCELFIRYFFEDFGYIILVYNDATINTLLLYYKGIKKDCGYLTTGYRKFFEIEEAGESSCASRLCIKFRNKKLDNCRSITAIIVARMQH